MLLVRCYTNTVKTVNTKIRTHKFTCFICGMSAEIICNFFRAGLDLDPSILHRKKMHYTRAFIQEVYRFRSLIPGSLTHKTSCKVNFMGYTIPSQTKVKPNREVFNVILQTVFIYRFSPQDNCATSSFLLTYEDSCRCMQVSQN